MTMHPQGGAANRDRRPNAGVDVCKQHLDVCVNALELRVANDASGWDVVTATLKEANVDLVVVEATGGYERGLVCALQQAGITVARWICAYHGFQRAGRLAVVPAAPRTLGRTIASDASIIAGI